MAWNSVVDLSRDIRLGWLLRAIHGNMASFVFMVLFIHFFRGLFYTSFYLKLPWFTGWIIIVLTIIAAFLGYVLPWGQMSFWGATVIINLLRVLPMGGTLVIWLWGGFYVSSFTCRFFYAVHFIVPFIVLIIVIIHLYFLHFRGRSSPIGSVSGSIKVKFGHLFLYKDLINLIFLWLMFLIIIIHPDWSSDPVNFIALDLSRSPIHIQPEWYFLHLYAILRSIPNKLGGLIGFIIALVLLPVLVFIRSKQQVRQLKNYRLFSNGFFRTNILLLWIGIQAVEEPFILIGQSLAFFYFFYFFYVLFIDMTISNAIWKLQQLAELYFIVFCKETGVKHS